MTTPVEQEARGFDAVVSDAIFNLLDLRQQAGKMEAANIVAFADHMADLIQELRAAHAVRAEGAGEAVGDDRVVQILRSELRGKGLPDDLLLRQFAEEARWIRLGLATPPLAPVTEATMRSLRSVLVGRDADDDDRTPRYGMLRIRELLEIHAASEQEARELCDELYWDSASTSKSVSDSRLDAYRDAVAARVRAEYGDDSASLGRWSTRCETSSRWYMWIGRCG